MDLAPETYICIYIYIYIHIYVYIYIYIHKLKVLFHIIIYPLLPPDGINTYRSALYQVFSYARAKEMGRAMQSNTTRISSSVQELQAKMVIRLLYIIYIYSLSPPLLFLSPTLTTQCLALVTSIYRLATR